MAYDRYTVEYHLTTTGWIRGTETYFGKVDKEVAIPENRVETWIKEVEQSSGWSPEDITWQRVWASPSMTEQERNELRAKFPTPPRFSN